MTALFLVVFLEQWKSTKDHASAVLGVFVSFVCLILFGPDGFLIPSLIMIPVLLTAARRFRGKLGVSDGSVS